VFGACAGAALYRRAALPEAPFDPRLFAYLEDVELALRLRLAGWRCRYEPVLARHAGGASSEQLAGGLAPLVQRNTLVLVARWFPPRWLPLVAYRQLGWAVHAAGQGRLGSHLRATLAAVPLIRAALRERRRRPRARVPIEEVIPRLPIRGPQAGGHRGAIAQSWGDGESR
jgi:GT2 family glycosyltransferase